jgi:hypothetical protein
MDLPQTRKSWDLGEIHHFSHGFTHGFTHFTSASQPGGTTHWQNTAAILRPDLLGTAPGILRNMMDMVRCQMMSDYPWWDKKRLHPLAGLAGRFQSLSGMKHQVVLECDFATRQRCQKPDFSPQVCQEIRWRYPNLYGNLNQDWMIDQWFPKSYTFSIIAKSYRVACRNPTTNTWERKLHPFRLTHQLP